MLGILISNSPTFERSECFYVTISENFERFQYLFSLHYRFSGIENLFEKLEYQFLIEDTKTENVRVSTKWTNHREQSFASNYFTFSNISFQFKNIL